MSAFLTEPVRSRRAAKETASMIMRTAVAAYGGMRGAITGIRFKEARQDRAMENSGLNISPDIFREKVVFMLTL